jgi:hypothetical protein
MVAKPVNRVNLDLGEMELSTLPTIYGCCGLFDLCSDQDLMSLSFEGASKFLDWIGWQKTNVCRIQKNFVTWIRPENDGKGASTPGWIQDPCGESNGVEWGTCDFSLDDFGLIRRHGPKRNATKMNMKYCEAQPRYRLDGTPITNDAEFDIRLTTEGIMQDLKHMIIDGNKSTEGQFDGIDSLIKTGYVSSKGIHCRSMDSIIIDWNDHGMSGGSGITWNGKSVAASFNFIDVLMAVVRAIRKRIKLAPALNAQPLGVGDVIIVGPDIVLNCIKDAFTCWSVCGGDLNSSFLVTLGTYEARRFRETLDGGPFGDGQITIDGFGIPLLAYEWGTIDAQGDSDVYILTGQIGNVRLINGQYNDLSQAPATYPEAAYSYTDGGRLLTWTEREKTCVYRETEMQPRLLMWAPWAEVRIEDVTCTMLGQPISPDPWSPYYPETSFSVPYCDPDQNVRQSE